ncbi:MAG: class I tRNA ligase family protein, partial [Bdellovibrionaceae bacterium]|nr:class I tRNA ligase family protein [Pseudobdellovibrionaceae bacterium]
VDPVEMIEKYGADALRMTFLAHIHSGKDFKFSEERLQGYRNFINKIWNATRYALGRFEALGVSKQAWSQELQVVNMSSFDHWILHRLLQVESQVHQAWEQYRFSDAAGTLYQFMWHEFCDWYIEFSKPIFESAPTAEKVETAKVMRLVLERALRLLSPMIPFVTEYLYSQLPATSGSCMLQAYPSPHNHGAIRRLVQVDVGHQVELIKGVLHAIRNIRGENRLSPALELEVRLQVEDEGSQKVLSAYKGILSKLGRTKDISIASKQEVKQSAVMSVAVEQYRVQVIIPLSGLIDLEEEIKRLEKNLLKVNQSLGALVARLGNEKFIKNADPEVVESDKAQAVQLRFQKESLEQAIVRLKMT